VAQTVEFDELLRAFDPDTRRAFQQWQRTTSAATSGHARDINDSLGNLPGFLEGAADVAGVLAQRQEALRGLVRGTGTTFAALTRNEQALRDLIVRNEDVMTTLSQHRESLAESIRIFPTFLRETRFTLDRLRTFSTDTRPLVRDLKPLLDDVRPTLRAVRDLAPDLRALFADLRPLIAAGKDGLPALGAVLRGLDPTLAETGPLLQQLNPILQYLELNQITLTNFLDIGEAALKFQVTPASGGKSLGHALPQLITLGSQSLAADERTPDNRGNAYFGPEALRNLGLKDPSRFSHPSFDCNHVGEKPPSNTPGCFTQGPQTFRGKSGRYPRVEPAGRGGG
jgi:ABC-type transporter Mla subunit MlaD